MAKNIKRNIYFVGKTDPDVLDFHGHEYTTHYGTSYNSYLIKEEKTVLIDSVKNTHAREFVDNLKKEIDLEKIDFIVSNHSELDHGGAFNLLMKYIPDTPIYCSAAGINSLRGYHHSNWNLKVVKTGDRISIGNGKELFFIEAPLLHWPDSMFCYLSGDAVLFSNDAFGQHFSSDFLFNDSINEEIILDEALKYFANILAPYSKLVERKIQELQKLDLPLDMICPSHGAIWRKNPKQIINKYLEWSKSYSENQISIVYETMYNSTKVIAKNIEEGIRELKDDTAVKIFNVAEISKSDIIAEIFKSKLIFFGCPTINRRIMSNMAGLLELLIALQFKTKQAAVFGSYGWSGESLIVLEKKLRESGFLIAEDNLKIQWRPNEEARSECRQFVKELLKEK